MKHAKKSPRRHAPRVFQIATLLSLTSLPLIVPAARATNYYWDGTNNTGANAGDGISEGGTGPWDKTNTYWDTGTAGTDVIWADGNTAIFGSAGVTGGTVTLGVPISALNLQFLSTGYTITPSTANTLTFTGGFGTTGAGATIYAGGATGAINSIGGPITVAATGTSNAYLSAAAGNTLNLTGTIAESAVTTSLLTIYGPGTINYSGTAFTPGKFNVQGGATFNTSGAMTISLNGTYTGIGGDSTALSTWNVNTGSAIAAATTLFVGNGTGTSGAMTVNGGTASFSAINAGNSFSNATDTNAVGTITVNGGTLTSTGAVRLGGGLGTGTLNLNGGTFAVGNTIARGIVTGANTGGSAVVNLGGGTLQATTTSAALNTPTANISGTTNATFDTNAFAIAVAANLANSNGSTAGVTKIGTGTLTLSGINTYTGNTLINAGTLLSTSTNSLPGFGTPSRITVANGAGLALRVGGTTGYTSANLDSVLNSTSATFGTSSILGVDTTNGDFTYGTNITGSVGLQKIGSNRLILTGNNTYTGTTTLSGGIITLGNNGALGTGTLAFTGGGSTVESSDSTPRTIANALTQTGVGQFTFGNTATFTGALNFTSTAALAVGGASTPVRSFAVNVPTTLAASLTGGQLASTKSGAGTLTLSGNNAAITGGAFTVTAGTLLINGNLGAAAGAPAVNVTTAGASAGGSGHIFGTLTLAAGTTLTPGPAGANSIGTLSTGAVSLSSTTNSVFDLGTTAAGGSDLVAVTGNLTLAGTLTVNQQAGFGTGNYELFSYSGTLTNNGLTATAPTGFTYTVDTTSVPNEVLLDVTATAAPEPSTWATMLGGLGGMLALKLRRKRRA